VFGVDVGPSKAETTAASSITGAGNFATSTGESDINSSTAFMSSILSGDPTKISSVLAPQIGAAKTAQQQQAKTNDQFGNRGGGTNASTAAGNDKTHADITSAIASLTGSAATNLGSEGSNLLGTGINATQTAFTDADTIQKQKAAQLNDIVGSALGVGKMITGGFSGLAASPAGANQSLAFLSGAGF